jgi:uncharacterized membrane protein YhaH (DUF805 family)
MPPLGEPMSSWSILFSLRGRVPRAVFWQYGVVGPLVLTAMLDMLLGIVGVAERYRDAASSLLPLWPCIAVAVKRWHDRDKSGWWILLNLVPVIGLAWSLLENGFLRGTPGPNRFGQDLRGRF